MQGINAGNTAFILMCTALVCMMTPALALFYGGLVKRRDTVSIMIQNFVCIGVVGLIWVFGGFSLVFGPSMMGGLIPPLRPCGTKLGIGHRRGCRNRLLLREIYPKLAEDRRYFRSVAGAWGWRDDRSAADRRPGQFQYQQGRRQQPSTWHPGIGRRYRGCLCLGSDSPRPESTGPDRHIARSSKYAGSGP